MPKQTDHEGRDANWWDERAERAEMPLVDVNGAGEVRSDLILFRSCVALETIATSQPQFLCGGWLARKLTTILSAAGGTGKSALNLQLALEMSTGRSLLGHAAWTSPEPLAVVYLNGEDACEGTNYWLSRYLRAYELQQTPPGFHYRHVSELNPRFLLDADGTDRLIASLEPLRPDVVMLDTAIALLPPARNNLNPEEIRHRLDISCARIGMNLNCGVLLNTHDNRRGEAVSGPTSWTDFSRLTLHLRRWLGDGRDDMASGELRLSCVKSNFGWPRTAVRLRRDPETLLLRVFSDPSVGAAKSRKLSERETWRRLKVAVEGLLMKAEDERQTGNVREYCRALARTFPARTTYADSFVRTALVFHSATNPRKRTRNAHVVVAVRPESEWPVQS